MVNKCFKGIAVFLIEAIQELPQEHFARELVENMIFDSVELRIKLQRVIEVLADLSVKTGI